MKNKVSVLYYAYHQVELFARYLIFNLYKGKATCKVSLNRLYESF